MQPHVIADDPLHIRPLANADIDDVYRACQDPEVQRWTVAIPVPYTRADAEWFVRDFCPAAWAEDREYTWGIENAASHGFLGVVSLRLQDGGGSEIGFWLAPDARGRGVMTRAAADVCRFAFDELGRSAVTWRAIVGNEASRRVAERLGFDIATPVRGLLNQRGVWVDGWIGTLPAQ